jgi:hypothetical protein
MDYRLSLIGFHNPYEHRGLTPRQFLVKYVTRQKSLYKKRDGWKRRRLVGWIEKHWDSQLHFVARLFPHTLKT